MHKVFHLIWTLSPSVGRSCYRRKTQWGWWVPVCVWERKRKREKRDKVNCWNKHRRAKLSSQANNSPRSALSAGTAKNWTTAQSSSGNFLGNMGSFLKRFPCQQRRCAWSQVNVLKRNSGASWCSLNSPVYIHSSHIFQNSEVHTGSQEIFYHLWLWSSIHANLIYTIF